MLYADVKVSEKYAGATENTVVIPTQAVEKYFGTFCATFLILFVNAIPNEFDIFAANACIATKANGVF